MMRTLGISPRALAREAVTALMASRLRATLSATGIIVGIATVMTATEIGAGAREAALSEIGALGIDNVFVRAVALAPASGIPGRQRTAAPELTLTDADVIRQTLETAQAVSAARVADTEMKADSRRTTARLAGVTPGWHDVADPDLAAGRWWSADDIRLHRRVAVIGGGLARDLFGGIDPIGARVSAGDTWYYVVGTLRARASGASSGPIQSLDIDRALIVPLTTMDVSLGEGDAADRVGEIGIRLRGADEVERAAQIVTAILQRRHRDQSRYEVVVPRELLRARLRARRAFNVVLGGIGALALVISGVGIMNIMLANVSERTQEIGVRRAFGARRSAIIAQFAIEAVVLCAAGGVAGVPLGVALSAVVAVAAGWPVSLSPWAVLLALGLANAVGLVFGIYPAHVAANIEPVDALRAR
jgi:putative ABC transport system permease protein